MPQVASAASVSPRASEPDLNVPVVSGVPSSESAVKFHRDMPPEAAMEKTRALHAAVYTAPSTSSVPQACAREIVQFCYSEVGTTWPAYERSTSVDDAKVALRDVNACLARSSSMISQPCFDALIAFLKLPPSGSVLPSIPPGSVNSNPRDSDNTLAMDPNEKHHRNRHNRSDRQRFRHGRYDDDDSDDCGGSGVHPLVWVFMLPFFFLGLFVAVKKGVKHFQMWHCNYLRQQHQLLSSSDEVDAQREDLAPLKIQEPS